jgi:hypothetical protein
MDRHDRRDVFGRLGFIKWRHSATAACLTVAPFRNRINEYGGNSGQFPAMICST